MRLTAEEPTVAYALRKQRMSAEEFLAWDETQDIRHEFVAGEVFAMAGGKDANDTVAGNLYMALRQHLHGTPCRTFGSNVKLRVEAADCYFYPDVMVTCGAADAADRFIKRQPKLVIEVLSSSTASFDRGAKFSNYQLLPTLAEYLLVDVERQHCDLYRKGTDNLWVLHPSGPKDAVQLASVDLLISAATLWADLDDEAAASAAV